MEYMFCAFPLKKIPLVILYGKISQPLLPQMITDFEKHQNNAHVPWVLLFCFQKTKSIIENLGAKDENK